MLLAIAGAAIGVALAWWGRDLLLALRPFGNASVVLDLPLDARVLGFTLVVTMATALLFGLAPALRTTRVDLTTQLQSGTRTIGGAGRSRLRQSLTVLQVALSLVLLISTGLFVRTLGNLRNVDVGFNTSGLILFRIDAASAGYTPEQYAALQARLQETLERLPGVRAATFSSVALLSRTRQNKRMTVAGKAPPPDVPIVNTNGLAPNFFTAMQLPLVLGRGFTARDDGAAPRVAVVNQAFVHTYLGDDNPIGRRIGIGPAATDQVEIVGVAADAKYTELRGVTPETIYLPAFQRLDGTANFAVRLAAPAHTDVAAVLSAIRAAVRAVDPALPVLNLRTQDEQIERLHAQELLFARLSGLFGLLAVALAGIGLYGLMSHAVIQRTGEIGLRMALGASSAHVLWMILRESLALVCLGIVAGMAAAYGSARLVATMLFGLSPTDPVTYGSVALILVVIGVLASLVPARRASRIDPSVAMTTS